MSDIVDDMKRCGHIHCAPSSDEIERLRDQVDDGYTARKMLNEHITALEAEKLKLRDMLRRVDRQLGLGMTLEGEVALSRLINAALKEQSDDT